MAQYKLVVLTNAVEGHDADFNAWYDDPHLGDVLKVAGFTSAQRFVLGDAQLTDAPLTHKYLAIYDFETDDLDATLKTFLEFCEATMFITPSLAPDALPMVYKVIGPAQTKDI